MIDPLTRQPKAKAQPRSRLAELIAQEEGYGIPGARPTRLNNPGDLRHGPHAHHSPDRPNDLGTYTSPEEGEADLTRQLQLYADRGLTLNEMVLAYAPPTDNNSPQAYLTYLCTGLGLPPTALVSEALLIPATPAPAGTETP